MPADFLADRKKGLEEAFFAEQDAILRRRLREADQAKAHRDALASASSISDAGVLDKLAAAGLTSETLAALSLVPLVAVAWADGEVDERERAAALSAADEAGLSRGSPSHALLEGWLAQRPPPGLYVAWKAYAAALSATLDPHARQTLRTGVMDRARTVAEAAGGFLGLGRRVSDAERATLDELARAFDG